MKFLSRVRPHKNNRCWDNADTGICCGDAIGKV